MSIEENKAVSRRIIEFYENPDIASEIFAENFIGHFPGIEIRGSDEARQYIGGVFKIAFPDLQLTFHDMIAEGDLVTIRWTMRGTHRGDYRGIAPTGKEVTWSGISIDRYFDGKIIEGWTELDLLGLLQQLGAISDLGQRSP